MSSRGVSSPASNLWGFGATKGTLKDKFHLVLKSQFLKVTCTHTWKFAPLAMWLETSLSKKGLEKKARKEFKPCKVGVIGPIQLKHHSRKSKVRSVSGGVILSDDTPFFVYLFKPKSGWLCRCECPKKMLIFYMIKTKVGFLTWVPAWAVLHCLPWHLARVSRHQWWVRSCRPPDCPSHWRRAAGRSWTKASTGGETSNHSDWSSCIRAFCQGGQSSERPQIDHCDQGSQNDQVNPKDGLSRVFPPSTQWSTVFNYDQRELISPCEWSTAFAGRLVSLELSFKPDHWPMTIS